MDHDAVIVVSFGGPEGMADVMPFLDNVLRGKAVPEERKKEVARHYEAFGGVSPINAQNRELIGLLEREFSDRGLKLPIYWGNRNWKPYLHDAIRKMADDGVRRAVAYVTSAFSSYSGCRQYLENISAAVDRVGAGAPRIEKLRGFYNHPLFIRVWVERIREALGEIAAERRAGAEIVFTAHSIPAAMSAGCDTVEQLRETCRLVMEAVGERRWSLAYQSRSGPPSVPWLEPDICDRLDVLKREGIGDVVVAPVGFVSDHMEVLYDLDHEAREHCARIGLNMLRARTPGTHPLMIRMIRELVEERVSGLARQVIGRRPPLPDVCPPDCCRYERGPRPQRR